MEDITVTNDNRPSNDVIFGLVFEDKDIFKTTMECVLGEEIDETNYVVSQKERVKNMGLYQEKYQSRYLTENDVRFYLEQGGEERAEEMAVTAIKKGLSFDLIKELTGFEIEKIEELKEQLK